MHLDGTFASRRDTWIIGIGKRYPCINKSQKPLFMQIIQLKTSLYQ